MEGSLQRPISRRTAVAAFFGIASSNLPVLASSEKTGATAPVVLDEGLEIRDFRILPGDDSGRFMLELHNGSSTAMDTPSVGLESVSTKSPTNFAWANSLSSVLYPGMSDLLIGVAPDFVLDEKKWNQFGWQLCGNTTTQYIEQVADWDFETSTQLEIVASDAARIHLQIVSQAVEPIDVVSVQTIVRDVDGRICGSLPPLSVWRLEPEALRKDIILSIYPGLKNMTNPFNFITTVENLNYSFSFQPSPGRSINPSCNPVMPWG